jgi:hypothetical protein
MRPKSKAIPDLLKGGHGSNRKQEWASARESWKKSRSGWALSLATVRKWRVKVACGWQSMENCLTQTASLANWIRMKSMKAIHIINSPGISTLRGITFDCSDEKENEEDSIRVNRAFDSDEIDESDSHDLRQHEPKISISPEISIRDDVQQL